MTLGSQSQLELIIVPKQTLCVFRSFVFCFRLFDWSPTSGHLDRKREMA